MTTEAKVKAANYSPEQEQTICNAVKLATGFDSQKVIIEQLALTPLFAGKTPRQLLSKLMHLSKSKASDRPVYFPKVYQPKTAGVTVVKKSAILDEITSIIDCQDDALESLQGATKAALLLVLDFCQKAKESNE